MTDIIARLRNRIHDSPIPAEHLMDDAADEIERLRAALEEIAIQSWEEHSRKIAEAALNQQTARNNDS